MLARTLLIIFLATRCAVILSSYGNQTATSLDQSTSRTTSHPTTNPVRIPTSSQKTNQDVYFSSVTNPGAMNGNWQYERGRGKMNPFVGPSAEKNTTEELLPSILNQIMSKSDSRLRPKIGREPITVYTDMYILDIGDISEANMEFRVSFFYRQYWRDERLSYENTGYNKRLALNAKMVQDMWIPDIYFVNEKSGVKHDLTKQNEVVRLWPNGQVFHSMRLSMTASCPMRLHNYPMDKQTCKLDFESFSYPATEMLFKWNTDGGNKEVIVSDELEIPQFILTEYSTSSNLANFTSGSYSRLTVVFKFERSIGFFLIQTYIPAYLIVMLSWIAFWIKHTSTPARIALGITTVLTMTTLTNSARTSLPKVSYVKSIEWFLIICFLYVFMSLVEFGCVSYEVNRKMKTGVRLPLVVEQEGQSKEQEKENIMYVVDGERGVNGASKLRPMFSIRGKPKRITKFMKQRSFSQKEIEAMDSLVDHYSRILFPASFIFINILYWSLTYNAS